MATDEQNFRAETTKVAGLAFLTPMGRILLDPLPLLHGYNLFEITIYSVYALGLAFLGIIFILKGHDILIERRK
ncbi:MAG: hypothetical protein HYR97_04055 [Candidatus Melainabacteria bacterium]|nr:hypothetical protein [Candidatus Melainabacteria bacterium]MBI3307864.1 hypothetical protein [Candidatus Melainabacteria bacterium]